MAEGEGAPVILSEKERTQLREIESGLEQPEDNSFHTKGLLDHFREREKPPTTKVEQIKDLIEFLNARKDDSSNKDAKKRLENMKKIASELVYEKYVQANKGKFVEMRRYVIGQKEFFTGANQDTIGSLLEVIPEPYPTSQLDPKNAATELQQGDISVDGIDKFFEKAAQDNTEMGKESQWKALRAAVGAAAEFKAQQSEKHNSRVIVVVIKNGKVEKNPYWSSEAETEVKPEKGVFIFAPQADEDDPLSLNRAAKSVDRIFRDIPKMIKEAKAALEKIKNDDGDNRPTQDEELAVVRTLEVHQEYFTEKVKGKDKPKTVDTLEKMIDFVNKKLGKKPQAEKELEQDPGDMAGALGRPLDPDILQMLMLAQMANVN